MASQIPTTETHVPVHFVEGAMVTKLGGIQSGMPCVVDEVFNDGTINCVGINGKKFRKQDANNYVLFTDDRGRPRTIPAVGIAVTPSPRAPSRPAQEKAKAAADEPSTQDAKDDIVKVAAVEGLHSEHVAVKAKCKAAPRKAKRKTAADFYGKGSASASLTQELEAATPCPNVKDEQNQGIGGGGAYWVEEMAVKRLKKR